MKEEEIQKLISSNAKAIEALTSSLNELKQEWQKDREESRKYRKQMYEWMSRLAASQANFWESQ